MAIDSLKKRTYLILTTWFGVGFSPWAPGTFGSLASLPFAFLIMETSGLFGIAIAAAVIFVIGTYAVDNYVLQKGKKDPGEAVIDEVAGQFLPLLVAPYSIEGWIFAFILFRVFDIWKPWPCNWVDQKLSGGLGVMLDDVAAGTYAGLVIIALRQFGVL
jgi:phosphatidylglycerophosphatase A